MDHFPLFASLGQRPCLVVGGGEVAARKVAVLLAAGARVTVNAPVLCPSLALLGHEGRIRVVTGPFQPELVGQHLLVVAATAEADVNREVAATADAEFRLCNVVDDGAASSFISPAVVDRSPLLIAISSGGHAPVLARRLRQWLDTMLPRRLGELAAWAGRWRPAVRDTGRDLQARLRFWERLFDGEAARQVLDGRAGDADDAVRTAIGELARGEGSAQSVGKAWLVGAGPGDPGLLTLRGHQVLARADVVLHDRLVSKDVLAFARRDAELVPVGKTGDGPSTSQAEIDRMLVDRVRSGQRVCRLKGGDPFVFGRGGEEASALAAAGLPFEVVPGVTAASGCGTSAGIPLTHRGLADAVTFVSARSAAGPDAEADWAGLAGPGRTLAVYMPAGRLKDLCAALVAHGHAPTTPAAVVTAGTTPEERIIRGTLADIAARTAEFLPERHDARARDGGASIQGPPPAILYVGEVAALDLRAASSSAPASGAETATPSGADGDAIIREPVLAFIDRADRPPGPAVVRGPDTREQQR